jgi:hypothetical protein
MGLFAAHSSEFGEMPRREEKAHKKLQARAREHHCVLRSGTLRCLPLSNAFI